MLGSESEVFLIVLHFYAEYDGIYSWLLFSGGNIEQSK